MKKGTWPPQTRDQLQARHATKRLKFSSHLPRSGQDGTRQKRQTVLTMGLEYTVGGSHGLVLSMQDMSSYKLPMGQGPLHPVSTWDLTVGVLAVRDHL
jgi:hypothetical protein